MFNNIMDSKENKICRLCLNTCNGNFETIQDIDKEMLEILSVNMDFNISDDCVKCLNCTEMLKKCFEFKSICVHTEDKLIVFIESRNINRASMTQVYLEGMQNKKMDHFNTTDICRFCMKPSTTYFDLDEKIDEYFRDMLQKFLPEVTLYFTNNPVSCSNCLDTLKSYFIFLKYLHLVEEHIKAYCETECEIKSQKVILNNVVQHVFKKILREKIFIEEQLAEVYFSGLITKNCIKKQSKIKNVPLLETMEEITNSENYCLESSKKEDCIQNYLKSEEIEIKTDEAVESDNDRNFLLEEIINENCHNDELSEGCTDENNTEDIDTAEIKIEDIVIKLNNIDMERLTKSQVDILEENSNKTDERDFNQGHDESDSSVSNMSQENNARNISHNAENKSNMVLKELVIRLKREHFRRYKNNCNYKSSCMKNLTIHLKCDHGIRLLSCHHCGYKTHLEDCLKKHLVIHGGNAQFKCPQCQKVYTRRQNIENHFLRKHDNLRDIVTSKIHSCTICSYKTTIAAHLVDHIDRNHSRMKKYQCNDCLHTFVQKRELTLHISSVHLKLRPYICKGCNKKFSRKTLLDGHIISHHQKNLDLMKTVTNKIYNCDHCTYKTMMNSVMKKHIKTHNKHV